MSLDMQAVKDKIRQYVLGLGVDDVGFASVKDYISPRSPKIEDLFPSAKSMVVMAFKEMSNCDSPSHLMAMSGRLDLMEFMRSCNYKLGRFIEKEFKRRAMSVPISYPQDMGNNTMGLIGEVSLRHAAQAAGLGRFGRHNLIIHPKMGSRVLFSAVLNELDLPSDPPVSEDLCIYCDICIQECPSGALNEEGKTNPSKCLRSAQPYGIGGSIGFWSKLLKAAPDEQKKLLVSEEYMKLYQAQIIGYQYHCFKCLSSCPVGDFF